MVQPRPAPLRLAGGTGSQAIDAPDTAWSEDSAAFERVVLSNIDAAHNLAWWLMRNDHDAADVVQEACLKAWRAFAGLRSSDARAWLLAIVRNTAFSKMRREKASEDDPSEPASPAPSSPAADLLRRADAETVRAALGELPDAQREVLVLCDLEGLTYSQIGLVIGVPTGTVMSRIARARDALRARLSARLGKEY
jgi:RNA polymerase sigma-70 factor (ECF subfamily)